MILKFFSKSEQDGSKPIKYFLGNEKDRDFARVLSGDPVVTEHLINATPFQHKFKAGVLSFTERADEISEEDKFAIMRSCEKMLFPGLEHDQYDVLWIEHSDKDIDKNNPVGRLELNFLIPCQELRSGKRLQPYYAAADKTRANAWKNKINREFKTIDAQALSDPNAPNRKRKVHNYVGSVNRPSPHNTKPKRVKSKDDLDTSSRDALRESINQHILAVFNERKGLLHDRKNVVHELTIALELTIERTAATSITVSHRAYTDKNGKPMRVRLEGGLYHKDFDSKKFKPEAQSAYETNHVRRKLRDDHTFETGMQIKEQYHKTLYKGAVAPPALDIALRHVSVVETQQKPAELLSELAKASKIYKHKV